MPEGLATTTVAGGDLSATAPTRRAKDGHLASRDFHRPDEEEAILSAVRRLLARGLAPSSNTTSTDPATDPLCSRCLRRQSEHAAAGNDPECPDGFVARDEPPPRN